MTLTTIILLYIAFRLKHFLCDFILQTDWMANTKAQPSREGNKALFIHALIHAVGTTVATVIFLPAYWWLGVIDFFVHGFFDFIKGRLTYKMAWTPKDTKFWWAIGFDQELHNYTHFIYVLLIISALGGFSFT